MTLTAIRGDGETASPRTDVTRCLAAVWPLLLAASETIDGPRPVDAAAHLRAAAARLLWTAERLD